MVTRHMEIVLDVFSTCESGYRTPVLERFTRAIEFGDGEFSFVSFLYDDF